MQRITTRDIAKKAGVASATVSRALRNHPEIALETRQKIQHLAAQMGYRPDPLLSGLAAYRHSKTIPRYQSTIGIITNYPKLNIWQNWSRNNQGFYEGIMSASEQLGYQIEEFSPNQLKVTSHRFSEMLKARGIRGLIIPPRRKQGFLKLDWDHFSAVTIGFSLAHPFLNRVLHDHMTSTMYAMRHLRRLGYRRIGFAPNIAADARGNSSTVYSGYAVEIRRFPAQDHIPWFDIANDFSKFKSWLRKYQPDVVVGFDPKILEWLTHMKIKIPEKIGYLNLNLNDLSGKISGMAQQSKIIGATAVEILSGMMQRNECGIPNPPKVTLIEGAWIEGETVRSQMQK